MVQSIQIREQVNRLCEQVWTFNYIDHALVLTSWHKAERKSVRHRNYEVLARFNIYNREDEDKDDSNVPLPDWIKDAAVKEFLKSMKVGKWSELRGK